MFSPTTNLGHTAKTISHHQEDFKKKSFWLYAFGTYSGDKNFYIFPVNQVTQEKTEPSGGPGELWGYFGSFESNMSILNIIGHFDHDRPFDHNLPPGQ